MNENPPSSASNRDSSIPIPLSEEILVRQNNSQAIAKAWYWAIAHLGNVFYSEHDIHQTLTQLVGQAYTLLLAAEPDAQEAQHIGATVAELHYTQPGVLEGTLEILGGRLLAHLPDQEAIAFQPRLAWLLGQIASGFCHVAYDADGVGVDGVGVMAKQAPLNSRIAGYKTMRVMLQDKFDQLTQRNTELGHELARRERMETALRQYSDRLRALHDIDLAILSQQSLKAIAAVAVQRIKEMLPCHAVIFSLLELDGGYRYVLASDIPHLEADRREPILPWMLPMISGLMQGHVHSLSKSDIDSLTKTMSPFRELLENGLTLPPLVTFPLRIHHKLIGVFTVMHSDDQGLSQEYIEIGREIANATAIAVHNAQLLAAEQEASSREKTLRRLASNLTADLDGLLHLVLEQLATIVESNSSSILLADGKRLHVAAHRGIRFSPEMLADVETAGFTNMRHVLHSRQPLIIKDTTLDPQWIVVTGGEYIRCWLGAPLFARDRAVGILVLDHEQPDFYTGQDAKFVQAFADQVAVAIENAQLFQQIQEQADQLEIKVRERTRKLEALYKVSAIASAYLDLPTILQRSLKQILETLACNAGAIHLFDEQEGRLDLAAQAGLSFVPEVSDVLQANREVRGTTMLPPDHPLMGILFENGTPLHLPQATIVGYLCDLFQDCAIAPLRARGRLQGVLTLFSAGRDAFSPDDISLLEAIAEQIGLAIENNELRQQARQVAIIEERERLAHELHDSVTQGLYSLTLFAEAVRETAMTNDIVTVRRYAQSIIQTAQQSLREMRLLLYELRPLPPTAGGLVKALRNRLRTVEERLGVSVKLRANSVGELPAAVEEVYFRVALEALNNALRHANAENVGIFIRRQKNQLSMVIEDNGNGFNVEAGLQAGGMGLSSMQRRITKINGNIAIDSQPGQGTRITVTTLLPAEAEREQQ